MENPSTLTLGMLGVAAITSVAYLLTTSLTSSGSTKSDEDSNLTPKSFARYGTEYFLTNFTPIRSTGIGADGKIPRKKKNKKRLPRSNKEASTKSGNVRQHFKMSHLVWRPRASHHDGKWK